MNHFRKWMEDLEFDLQGLSLGESKPFFEGIDISYDDEWEIEKAARFELADQPVLAEVCRRNAGYSGL